MIHQPLKAPVRQTLEAYPRLTPPELDPPSYQILENTLFVINFEP